MPFNLKNFTVDKFNHDVNNSGDLDAKFNNWSAYRKSIVSLLERALEQTPNTKSIAVFGAGNLNDLDMSFLCNKFERIVLTDADTKSISDGLLRQNIRDDNLKKIETHRLDYTGAKDVGLFEGLERLAKKTASAQEIVKYIDGMFSKMHPSSLNDKFDLVISCPVYTQLVYTQIEFFLKILYEYGLYEYSELNKILSAAYNCIPIILKRYNDMVINTSVENGVIIMVTDIIEMKKGSSLHMKARKLVGGDSEAIEKLIGKKGIELAQIGRDDFLSKTKMIDSFYTIWPFDEEKEYLVFGALVKL